MKTALLVLDAQEIYTNPKSELYCKNSKRTLEKINKLIQAFHKAGNPIILVRHIHKKDGSDLGRMFDYAGEVEDFNFKEGSEEVEFAKGLLRPKESLEIQKKRYSAFADTGLGKTLNELGVERVVVCGFMTNFCCDSTARDAHDQDYFVDFIVDATGTPGVETMEQGAIRRTVGDLLKEGYACVYSAKGYLASIGKA